MHVGRCRDFDIFSATFDKSDIATEIFYKRVVVCYRELVDLCLNESLLIDLGLKDLGSLRKPHVISISRGIDIKIFAVGYLNGIYGACSGSCSADLVCDAAYVPYLVGGYQTARAVVDSYEFALLADSGKSIFDRLLSGFSAAYEADEFFESIRFLEFLIKREFFFFCNDDDFLYVFAFVKGRNSARNYGNIVKGEQLL